MIWKGMIWSGDDLVRGWFGRGWFGRGWFGQGMIWSGADLAGNDLVRGWFGGGYFGRGYFERDDLAGAISSRSHTLAHLILNACPVDYTVGFSTAIIWFGWDLYCTEFCTGSESGLHFDLWGRTSERRGFVSLLKGGCEIAEIWIASGKNNNISAYRWIV